MIAQNWKAESRHSMKTRKKLKKISSGSKKNWKGKRRNWRRKDPAQVMDRHCRYSCSYNCNWKNYGILETRVLREQVQTYNWNSSPLTNLYMWLTQVNFKTTCSCRNTCVCTKIWWKLCRCSATGSKIGQVWTFSRPNLKILFDSNLCFS